MGKAGVTLPPETIATYRQAFDTVLNANPGLKTGVDNATTGATPDQRHKSRLKAINDLIRTNEAFRNAVRSELSKSGLSPH